MNITYPGPLEAVGLPDGQIVAPGETVDVDDVLGAALVEQGWTVPPAPKPPKGAPKGAPVTSSED